MTFNNIYASFGYFEMLVDSLCFFWLIRNCFHHFKKTSMFNIQYSQSKRLHKYVHLIMVTGYY